MRLCVIFEIKNDCIVYLSVFRAVATIGPGGQDPPPHQSVKLQQYLRNCFPNLSMFSKFFKTIKIDLIFKIKKILLAIYLKIKFKPFKPFQKVLLFKDILSI